LANNDAWRQLNPLFEMGVWMNGNRPDMTFWSKKRFCALGKGSLRC
jgi:hypothetical protein